MPLALENLIEQSPDFRGSQFGSSLRSLRDLCGEHTLKYIHRRNAGNGEEGREFQTKPPPTKPKIFLFPIIALPLQRIALAK
jgi:hypothetical protein